MLAFVFSPWIPHKGFISYVKIIYFSLFIKNLLDFVLDYLWFYIYFFSGLLQVYGLIYPSLDITWFHL